MNHPAKVVKNKFDLREIKKQEIKLKRMRIVLSWLFDMENKEKIPHLYQMRDFYLSTYCGTGRDYQITIV